MTQNERIEPANQPLKKIRSGAITATIWSNLAKEGDGEYKTVSFERSFKDKDGVWKTTNSLRVNDLPRASLVLQKAYEYIALADMHA
jgi:hypothetical protein